MAFLAATALGLMAHALPFDPYGVGSEPKPPPVAPATQCSLKLYAAYAKNATDNELDTYAFSGTCDINVSPEGKKPVVQKVKVRIVSEWAPKMKRASESITVVHPDKTVEFSTWATCTADPFLTSTAQAATCTNQGMGANNFSYFLRKEDVPFAKRMGSDLLVSSMTTRIGARSRLHEIGKLGTVSSTTARTGASTMTEITFQGGPIACPMEVDFGDGSPTERAMFALQQGKNNVWHTYAKPGAYKVKATALPGCNGAASGSVIVYGAAAGSGK